MSRRVYSIIHHKSTVFIVLFVVLLLTIQIYVLLVRQSDFLFNIEGNEKSMKEEYNDVVKFPVLSAGFDKLVKEEYGQNKDDVVKFLLHSDILSNNEGKEKSLKEVYGQINDNVVTFHLIFTIPNFSKLNRRCIESIFYFHPNARLLIHSNAVKGIHTLEQQQLEPIQKLKDLGFHIDISPFDITDILLKAVDAPRSIVNKTLAMEYISLIPSKYSKGEYWFSHESDLMRTCVLYLNGGIYLDTDVVLVRPFVIMEPPHENDNKRNTKFPIPMNTITDYDGLAADNAMSRNHQDNTIECAVMKFLTPGNMFLGHAINDFMKNYDGEEWDHNGPAVFWRVSREMPHLVCSEPFDFTALNGNSTSSNISKSDFPCYFQPLPSTAFQPVYWLEWTNICYDENKSIAGIEARTIINQPYVYSVHMNNQVHGHRIEQKAYFPNTVCDLLLKNFCILCD